MVGETAYKEKVTEFGNIKIYNDVLASIAAIAAGEIKGVSRLGGGIVRSIFDTITRRGPAKGVRIDASETEVKLSVSIVVDYGVNIPQVADEVQENVKRQVERMTGLVLHEVNVDVEGVSSAAAGKTAAAA